MRKYEYTGKTKSKVINSVSYEVKQIRALRDIPGKAGAPEIKAGETGGWLTEDSGLNESDNSWLTPNACLIDGSFISGDIRVDESTLMCSQINGEGNIRFSNLFDCSFQNCDLINTYCSNLFSVKAEGTSLYLTNSKLKNVDIKDTIFLMNDSDICSIGTVPLVFDTDNAEVDIRSSRLFLQTEKEDCARVHGETTMEYVFVDEEKPLTMLAAFEGLEWKYLHLENMEVYYGNPFDSTKNGVSRLEGTAESSIHLKDAYFQSLKSNICGNIDIVGNLNLVDSHIKDASSILVEGMGALYLNNVTLVECATIKLETQGSIFLENLNLDSDNTMVV